MAKPKDPISLKPRSDEEGSSTPDASRSSDDLDLDGLDALREKLVTLRAEEGCGLDQNQLTSIHALVSYAAYDKGVNEEVVRTLVVGQFGVSDVTEIPKKSYEEVVRFLVGLNIKKAMN